MQPVPFPDKETDRIKNLRSYQILDTFPEPEFDELTNLISEICQTPIALVSFVDNDRQWFKSKKGIQSSSSDRSNSICSYAILQSDIFEIEDCTKDPIFKSNAFVTQEPNIRFYAGQPLQDENGFG